MSSKYYKIVQTVYVDAGFSRLLNLVSGYLSKIGWHVGDEHEDSLDHKPAQARWEVEDGKAAIVVYPTRSSYSMIGSGILIRFFHLRRFIQKGTQSISSIPNEIRSRFDNLPNAVEIEAHYLWHGDGDILAFLLGQYLTDKGCPAFMESLSGELIRIKRNPLLSPEERVERMAGFLNMISRSRGGSKSVQTLMQKRLSDVWSLIPSEAKKFLVTGVYLYEDFESAKQILLDMSPVSISLSKAVETVIAECLLLPFRTWYRNHQHWSEKSLTTDLQDTQLNRMAKFISDPKSKTPELGTFLFFLNIIRNSKNRMKTSIILQAFCEFAQELKDSEFLMKENDFTEALEIITTKYRNGAAHVEPQSFEIVHEFLTMLVGKEGHSGFLQRLVRAIQLA